jgi:hypothetical protein
MEQFNYYKLEESFARFERAAAKGHKESIWILSVMEGVEMDADALKEAFAKTETPLGWYFAGELSDMHSWDQFDFYKKSAEGGCSWGQVWYGWCFEDGSIVEKDKKVCLEWMEKAAGQNNPWAMWSLGRWFRNEGDENDKKAVSYFRTAAEMGWKFTMRSLAKMLRDGEGCVKDLRQAVIWSAKGDYASKFWEILKTAQVSLEEGTTERIICDFDQLCYTLGWGLYWYLYDSKEWNRRDDEKEKAFGNHCLDYYCSCVELQQKSIFTFLLFWNRTTGIKGPGQMIGQRVWEEMEDNLEKTFEERDGEEVPD